MSTYSVIEYAHALRHMVETGATSATLTQAVDAIADSLLGAGRRNDLRRLLVRLEDIGAGGVPVTRVTSAETLSAAEQAKFGKEVRVRTDASLLSGVRVQVGDRLVRASVRDRLQKILS